MNPCYGVTIQSEVTLKPFEFDEVNNPEWLCMTQFMCVIALIFCGGVAIIQPVSMIGGALHSGIVEVRK